MHIENEPHVRRPRTSMIPGNIEAVNEIVRVNRHFTVQELEDNVGYHNVNARWVSCTFTEHKKLIRMQMATHLLFIFHAEEENSSYHPCSSYSHRTSITSFVNHAATIRSSQLFVSEWAPNQTPFLMMV